MWEVIARIILRNRLPLLIAVGLVTIFMANQASFVQIRYDFAKLLPGTDSTLIKYKEFKERFGEDGDVLVIGIKNHDLYELKNFNGWYDLGEKVKAVDGVKEVVSVARLYQLTRNDTLKQFEFAPVVKNKPSSQTEVDSLKEVIHNLPFYEGVIYSLDSNATVMAATLSGDVLDTKERNLVVTDIEKLAHEFEKEHGIVTHVSGLPYIRSKINIKVASELQMFIILAAIVTALILYLFFRSFKVTMFSLLVVTIGVVWCFGLIVTLGYKISVLTGLIPPLIIVIGIPNCIYLLNKYQAEYKSHQNKILALHRVVRKVGNATLLTNATTASGFATFILVQSQVMTEFGIVASASIMMVFLLSLLLIPIIFSFLNPPKERHTRHLDRRWTQVAVDQLVNMVLHHRKLVYIGTFVTLLLCAYGITRLKTTGKMVEDLPEDDPVFVDLKFFERNFNGVMPFEIEIDTRKKGKVMSTSVFRKIDKLQDTIATYPQFGRPLSVVEVLKYSKQAFYRGDPKKYTLPSGQERNFIMSYVPEKTQERNSLHAFLDSNRQITRVSVHIEDIGTEELQILKDDISPKIDSIFNPDKYDVEITGTSVVFLKGNEYMIKNLFISLMLAVFVIACIMAFMFRSARMVIVSLIPNIIPLLVTAALMGYFNIPIKMSTILVFSIAFGISVDDTIHFLAKYRQELKLYGWNIRKSVILALKEVGISMIYTSIVLFCGFSIFMASNFGGTKALGLLVSLTLLVAMFSNLIILPSLILSFEKALTTKAFKEPMIQFFDEEEDIELDELKVEEVEETENS